MDKTRIAHYYDTLDVEAYQAMKEALELTLATMGRLEAKYGPFLSVQGTRDVAHKALTLTNGEKVEDITHLINQVRHLHD